MIESGCHRTLNAALRHHYGRAAPDDAATAPERARYLLGVHDIDAFVTDVAADSGACRVIADLAAEIATTSGC